MNIHAVNTPLRFVSKHSLVTINTARLEGGVSPVSNQSETGSKRHLLGLALQYVNENTIRRYIQSQDKEDAGQNNIELSLMRKHVEVSIITIWLGWGTDNIIMDYAQN